MKVDHPDSIRDRAVPPRDFHGQLTGPAQGHEGRDGLYGGEPGPAWLYCA